MKISLNYDMIRYLFIWELLNYKNKYWAVFCKIYINVKVLKLLDMLYSENGPLIDKQTKKGVDQVVTYFSSERLGSEILGYQGL